MDVILKEELEAIDLSREQLLKSLENFPEVHNGMIFTEYYNDRFEATSIKSIKNYSVSVNIWFRPFQYGKYSVNVNKQYEGFEFSYQNTEGENVRINSSDAFYEDYFKEFTRFIKCDIRISLTIKNGVNESSTSLEIPLVRYNHNYIDDFHILRKEIGFISREHIINKITNNKQRKEI